jgi:hypothetical protein
MIIKSENAAVISLSTIGGDSWLGIPLKRNPKKYIRFDMHRGFIYAKKLGENRSQIKLVVNGDPHIPIIP